MAVVIQPVDINEDQWGDLCSKVNDLITVASTNALTAGGIPAVGDSELDGTLTVNSLITQSISLSGSLSLTSLTANTGSITNLTANTIQSRIIQSNSAIVQTANVTTINANTINTNNIPNFTSNNINVTTINAGTTNSNVLNIVTATITTANVTTIDTGTVNTENVNSNNIVGSTISTSNAEFTNIKGLNANLYSMNANNAKIQVLTVDNLIGFNPTSLDVQYIHANNAQLDNLTVSTLSGFQPNNFNVSGTLTSGISNSNTVNANTITANTVISGPITLNYGNFTVKSTNSASYGSGQAVVQYRPSSNTLYFFRENSSAFVKIAVDEPISSNHATTKNYVDSGLSGKADSTALTTAPTMPVLTTSSTTTDWNTVTSVGWHNILIHSNGPNGPSDVGYYYVHVLQYGNGVILQVAYPYQPASAAQSGGIWMRRYTGSAWEGWKRASPKITVSTAAPSGGNDGDIWLQV